MRAPEHGGAALAPWRVPLGVEQVVDLREAGVDPDRLGARLGEQVLAERAAAVHLHDEPSEVAKARLARAKQRLLLASKETGVGSPRRDSLDLGCDHLVAATANRRHALRV